MTEFHSLLPLSVGRLFQRVDEWIRTLEPNVEGELGPSARLWGNPRWAIFCCFVLAATLLMPADGFGIRLCLFHQLTGMDCPGCGMTRGIGHLWRGELPRSIQLHLFAPIAFLFLFVQSGSLFLKAPLKKRILHFIDRNDTWFRYLWIAGGAIFFVYGGLRIAYQLLERGFLRGV